MPCGVLDEFAAQDYTVSASTSPLRLMILVALPTARSQETIVGETLEMDSTELQYALPDTLPESSYCDRCNSPLDACHCDGIDWPRFGMYLKAGPSFQMGESVFKNSTKVGYEITFGGRELLLPYNRQVFVDIGGSYLSAFGRGQSQTISGVIDRSGLGSQRLTDFMDETLDEIRRASVHAALGWYYDFSDVPEVSRLVTMRFGGRLSHVNGHFHEQPTATLQSAIDAANSLGIGFTLANDQVISKTDTSPGIFGGIELANTRYAAGGATISFLIDGEFAERLDRPEKLRRWQFGYGNSDVWPERKSLVQSEADLQRDLVLHDLSVVNATALLDNFIPVQVM